LLYGTVNDQVFPKKDEDDSLPGNKVPAEPVLERELRHIHSFLDQVGSDRDIQILIEGIEKAIAVENPNEKGHLDSWQKSSNIWGLDNRTEQQKLGETAKCECDLEAKAKF
jgi:hypothetical protein